MEHIVGVDEAGRGPLAGPVLAGAVILDPKKPIDGLADSKKLNAKQRESVFELIKNRALAWAVGYASVEEIDRVNILQATFLAMQRAVRQLTLVPHLALVDGNQIPILPCKATGIIRGDETELAISAASIMAKVMRDREMVALHSQFPQYGFAKHKGYGTKEHLAALYGHGPCIIHRRSFAPIAKLLNLTV